MNAFALAWIAMASASLTLGLIHLFVWTRGRERLDFLAFFVLAVAAAAFGFFELQMMRAATPQASAAAIRAAHVPLAIFVVFTAVFVRLHFSAGRIGLLVAIVALRAATLVLNFTTGVNVNFQEIVALEHPVLWGGEAVSVPIGTASNWAVVPHLSNVLLLCFVVDASVALWRRGGLEARRRALVVGGGITLCIAATAAMAALAIYGVLPIPTILTPAFLAVVLATSFELGGDVLRSAQLANALAASQARFGAVVEATPSAILVVDGADRIALVNSQAERSFCLPREQLVGQAIEALLPLRMRQGYAQLRMACAAKPEAVPMGAGCELAALRADGSEFPVEISLTPLRAPGIDQVLVSLVDISERRLAEQAAAQQRSELAHVSRVAMLGELSGSLAHEINQPLAAILANAQAALRFMAHKPPALQRVRESLDAIVTNDRRASTVIEHLRTLLRKGEVALRPVNLNELVEESLYLLRTDLALRGVAVHTDLEPELPLVTGDRVQLQQLLLNLLLNACDAMSEQPAPRPLEVSTARAGRMVCVEVADRGPGIAPQDSERVFEPFVTTKAHGLGIGLALCRNIAQAHHGRIGAGQNPGGGARLRVELPGPGKAAA